MSRSSTASSCTCSPAAARPEHMAEAVIVPDTQALGRGDQAGARPGASARPRRAMRANWLHLKPKILKDSICTISKSGGILALSKARARSHATDLAAAVAEMSGNLTARLQRRPSSLSAQIVADVRDALFAKQGSSSIPGMDSELAARSRTRPHRGARRAAYAGSARHRRDSAWAKAAAPASRTAIRVCCQGAGGAASTSPA